MKRGLVFFGVLAALWLAACAPKDTGPKPPDIVYGQDVCDQCGMIISETKFASATVLKDGQAHKFESIADMVTYQMMDHPEQVVSAWFVHDYNTEAWIPAETAFYVQSDSLNAPMPPSLAAFAKKVDAETFAQSVKANYLTFDEMRALVHLLAH
jgi:copper chaperone NosL